MNSSPIIIGDELSRFAATLLVTVRNSELSEYTHTHRQQDCLLAVVISTTWLRVSDVMFCIATLTF